MKNTRESSGNVSRWVFSITVAVIVSLVHAVVTFAFLMESFGAGPTSLTRKIIKATWMFPFVNERDWYVLVVSPVWGFLAGLLAYGVLSDRRMLNSEDSKTGSGGREG